MTRVHLEKRIRRRGWRFSRMAGVLCVLVATGIAGTYLWRTLGSADTPVAKTTTPASQPSASPATAPSTSANVSEARSPLETGRPRNVQQVRRISRVVAVVVVPSVLAVGALILLVRSRRAHRAVADRKRSLPSEKPTHPLQKPARKSEHVTREPTQGRESSSSAIYLDDGAWKVMAVSIAGTSHATRGLSCQDASYCVVLNGSVVVGAVADGAGSARRGADGAQIAVRAAVETVAHSVMHLTTSASDEQWSRLLLSAMYVARGRIEAEASVHNEPARELATTLLVFAAIPDLMVAAQIGDGAIVFRDQQGRLRSLTSPQNGEYANTTTFLVSPDAFQLAQSEVWRGEYTDIAAFTDGLQRLALQMPRGSPHPPFFDPLFDFAQKAGRENATQDLAAFLGSSKVTDRADDDLTLMLARVTT